MLKLKETWGPGSIDPDSFLPDALEPEQSSLLEYCPPKVTHG